MPAFCETSRLGTIVLAKATSSLSFRSMKAISCEVCFRRFSATDAEAENRRKQTSQEMAFMERKLKLDVAFANTIVPSRDVSQNAGMKVFINHGLTAQKVGAGNCQEYAACACSAL